jgi:hypothetical protein
MAAAGPGPSPTGRALRTLSRTARLALTAIAIVLGLAFGIPWLVGLVWR